MAVGIYYLDVDPELKGGALKFHPRVTRQRYGCQIDTHTGTAVVFKNSIPHRFRQIQNLTNKNRHRTLESVGFGSEISELSGSGSGKFC